MIADCHRYHSVSGPETRSLIGCSYSPFKLAFHLGALGRGLADRFCRALTQPCATVWLVKHGPLGKVTIFAISYEPDVDKVSSGIGRAENSDSTPDELTLPMLSSTFCPVIWSRFCAWNPVNSSYNPVTFQL